MHRPLLACFVGLGVAIALRAIPITAQPNDVPQNDALRNQSRGSQPTKQPQPHQAEAGRAGRDREQPPQPIQITVTAPEKTADEKKAETERANRQDQINQRIADANDRMAMFTLFLVVVGVLQLGAAAFSYGVARQNARTAHKQAIIALAQKRLGDRQLKHIETQVEIGRTNAEAAALSANVAKQTLVISHRAFLHVAHIEITPWGSANPEIAVRLKNTGRLAATITGWAATVQLGAMPAVRNPFELTLYGNAGPVAPEDVATLKAPLETTWGPDEWKALITGKMRFNPWGVIHYETGFPDVPGETGFGYEYDLAHPSQSNAEKFAATDARGYNYAK
jgi:hypothetical protein